MRMKNVFCLVLFGIGSSLSAAKLQFSDCPHHEFADRNLKIVATEVSKICKIDKSLSHPGDNYAYLAAICGSMKVISGCIRTYTGAVETDGISIHNSNPDQSESPFDPGLAKRLTERLKDSFQVEFKVTCSPSKEANTYPIPMDRFICSPTSGKGERYTFDLPSLSNFGPGKTETQLNIYWRIYKLD